LKKIVITEKQSKVLEQFELLEFKDHELMVKMVLDTLNLNYEPIVGTYRKGGEYFERPVAKIKADGETITPKELFDYLKFKNKSLGDSFLKQVILDWINGDIKDNALSKNVTIR
jgi:hypothetical protein